MQVNSEGKEIIRKNLDEVIPVYFGGFEGFEPGKMRPECKDHRFVALTLTGAAIHLRKAHGIYVNKRIKK